MLKPDLKETLAKVAIAEKDIIGMIDCYIEANSINAIIWAIGYTANYSLVKLPIRMKTVFPSNNAV